MANRRRGMKVGGKHDWEYTPGRWKETKVSPRKWKFTFFQTKHRKGYIAKKGTGFPEGGKLHWRIVAQQYAVKTGPNSYKIVTVGTKYRLGWKGPRERRWKK